MNLLFCAIKFGYVFNSQTFSLERWEFKYGFVKYGSIKFVFAMLDYLPPPAPYQIEIM